LSESRGHWYLITGLVIGFSLGIFFAWVLVPVEYVDTTPAALREDLKMEYLVQIALAYAANGDLARAQQRMALLEEPDMVEKITVFAQRALAEGRDPSEVSALGLLAIAAAQPPPEVPTAVPLTQFPTLTLTSTDVLPSASFTLTFAPTATSSPTSTPSQVLTATSVNIINTTVPLSGTQESTFVPTKTPSVTPRPRPTEIPSPTPGSPFVLDSRELICNPGQLQPVLVVQAVDSSGVGVPGVEIVINWPGGEEHFFTGLKREFGLGYADFVMTPEYNYTLRLADGSQRITDLSASECTADSGEVTWGTWMLRFIQP